MPNLSRLSAWLILLTLLLALLLWLPLRQATGKPDRPPLNVTDGGANMLLVGVDHRPGDWGMDFSEWPAGEVRAWADAIVLANIHGSCATAVSIPRDTLAPIPGLGEDRINSAMFHGGISQLKEVVSHHLGVPVDRYVIVDFSGFKNFVDAIGGVEVDVQRPLELPDGSVWIQPGTQRLDGEASLRFVRHRWGERRQDLDRIERQQQFLNALLREVREERLRRGMTLVVHSPELFKSDLQLAELWLLYRRAEMFDTASIEFAILPGRLVAREFWRLDRAGWNALRPRFLGDGPSAPPCTGELQ